MFIDYITVFKCLELNFWSVNHGFILPVECRKFSANVAEAALFLTS
jgi:hypothetical protein